jgi:hypothetical protein
MFQPWTEFKMDSQLLFSVHKVEVAIELTSAASSFVWAQGDQIPLWKNRPKYSPNRISPNLKKHNDFSVKKSIYVNFIIFPQDKNISIGEIWSPFVLISHVRFRLNQGCQIFLGTKYQNGEKSIKYTLTFHGKTLQNLPKFGFLVWKQTIWQPWSEWPEMPPHQTVSTWVDKGLIYPHLCLIN